MRIETGIKIFVALIWICLAACGALLAWHSWYVYEDYKDQKEIELRKILADRVLEGQELQDCLTQHCPADGCKGLEDWKEAYDQVFGIDTACAVAIYKKNPLGLQSHVPGPRSETCYSRAHEAEIYRQEGISVDLARKLFTSMDIPPAQATGRFLIPKKLNFVWMTSQKEFQTRPKAFFKINPHIFHNTKITPQWRHILWVSDLNLVPQDVKQQLVANKITIRSISELPITDPMHVALRELAMKYAQQEDWGKTSDIARDLVEYYEGGIYIDGDYTLLDIPQLELYMQSYRSFFGANLADPFTKLFEVINAFLASEPHGAVLKRKLALMYRNLIANHNAPDYIKYPCSQTSATFLKTGPEALEIAFLQAHSSTDALLPFCSLFQMPLYYPNTWQCISKHKLGKHDYQSTWVTKQNFVY